MSTWIKVYNSMPQHPKMLKAGASAAWLFVCGCCYSNEHLTDGFIAGHVLPVAAPGVREPEKLARKLMEVGLWHEVDGGWQIHDYGDHQRSSESVRDQRAKDAERKAHSRSGRSPANVHAESEVDSNGDSEPNPRGVQADREEKSREEEKASATPQPSRRRARRIDQDETPENFPSHLGPVLEAALVTLRRVFELRGGIEPQRRGVALGMLRNARADHTAVALRLEQWLVAGNGQRAKCRDIASRFGDWCEREPAARPEEAGNVVSMPSRFSEYDRAAGL